jgi:hypothetical protein
MLKIAMLDKRNAMFHRNQIGAAIGNVVTSLIATTSEAQINVLEYFIVLQRLKEAVKANSAVSSLMCAWWSTFTDLDRFPNIYRLQRLRTGIKNSLTH